MSKSINMTIITNDDLQLQKVLVEWNSTGLPTDKNLLKGIAEAILTDSKMDLLGKKASIILNPDNG